MARAALDRLNAPLPLLAKEFVLDEAQIDQARSAGADAVLLIARIVSPSRLRELVGAARAAGLEPLVEVVDEAELAAALEARARVIGVNARDLDTLAMDASGRRGSWAGSAGEQVAVHLSGLRTPDDVGRVARRARRRRAHRRGVDARGRPWPSPRAARRRRRRPGVSRRKLRAASRPR